jgi:hypothetical protein
MEVNLKENSSKELLRLFGNILDKLKERGIVRSRNNPVADYAEWLVSKAFAFDLQPNSNCGFDALDSKGVKYQIKARRLHTSNKSCQLSVIRDLEGKKFDFLIGVLFDKDFSILGAYKIPHHLIKEHSCFNKHQNGHILVLKGSILTADGVERIDRQINEYMASLEESNFKKDDQ